MIGGIIGDILGSVYEFNPEKMYDMISFSENADFTDDTVLSIAIADAIMSDADFGKTLYEYGNRYPDRGYGGRFLEWLESDNPQPYNSFGNGSAMRVAAVGWVANSKEEVLELAKKTALPTHNHPDGIEGAQAVGLAIWLSRNGYTKEEMRRELEKTFDYDLSRSYQWLQQNYEYDVTCRGSVPEAIIAFFESTDFTSAIRLAVALGGDADTQACIAGNIAEPFYEKISRNDCRVLQKLPEELREVVSKFYDRYNIVRVCEI